VVTYHTSHSNHYDIDTVRYDNNASMFSLLPLLTRTHTTRTHNRQLKKFGIQADICHLMCSHDHKVPDAATDGYAGS
jgi:hypothetical protein